ncbi:Putative osmoprotectant uptake system permease protein yehW, partial [Dysosmobacter welbionis]
APEPVLQPRPHGDHLCGHGHGNLLRRLGADGQTDGSVKAGVLLVCEPRRQQPLPAQGQLPLGANAAQVFGAAAQHLSQHLVVRLMAPGHHHHIVLRRHRHLFGQPGEVPAEGLLCFGEQRRVRELRPVVVHHGAEAQGSQHRHQGLRHMSAAEEIGPPGLHHRDGQPLPGKDRLIPAQELQLLRQDIQMTGPGPVCQAHGRHLLPLDPPQEPGV